MSPRWFLGMAAVGMVAALLAGGCDSSSDHDDDDDGSGGSTNNVNVDGAFSGTRSNTNGSANVSFNFNQSDDVLSGSYTDSSLGNGVITGTITGDDLEFTTVMASGDVIVEWHGEANAEGSAMSGTWTLTEGGSASGEWSAMR